PLHRRSRGRRARHRQSLQAAISGAAARARRAALALPARRAPRRDAWQRSQHWRRRPTTAPPSTPPACHYRRRLPVCPRAQKRLAAAPAAACDASAAVADGGGPRPRASIDVLLITSALFLEVAFVLGAEIAGHGYSRVASCFAGRI